MHEKCNLTDIEVPHFTGIIDAYDGVSQIYTWICFMELTLLRVPSLVPNYG